MRLIENFNDCKTSWAQATSIVLYLIPLETYSGLSSHSHRKSTNRCPFKSFNTQSLLSTLLKNYVQSDHTLSYQSMTAPPVLSIDTQHEDMIVLIKMLLFFSV